MAKYLTKVQVVSQFEEDVIPELKSSGNDSKDIRKEAWHIFLDTLYRDGKITKNQKDKWLFPERAKMT